MRHRVKEVKLPNGMRGLLIHVPGASVMSFDFNFRAGEYLVSKKKWETPHLMEHLLLGANKKYPRSRLFQEEMEKNGAYANASTGTYDIIYEAECADFEWKRILNLLTLAITKPLFLAEEFHAEAGNVREELTARSNNHFRTLSMALRGRYGFKVLTDHKRLEMMKNVRLEDIINHYQKTHTAKNLRFIIAGKLPASRQQHISKVLVGMNLPPGDKRIPLPEEKPDKLDRPMVIRNKTVDNVYFYIDTFARKRLSEPQMHALSLANALLTETMYSRILGTAREKGLAYSMNSSFAQSVTSTNWWFGAQVRPDNALGLFEIITNELKRLRAGDISNKELMAVKKFAIGRFQRSGQTVGGIAGGYASRYFFDGKIEDYYKVPKKIRAVGKQNLIDTVNHMFKDKVWGMGLLGNTKPALTQELYQQVSKLWR